MKTAQDSLQSSSFFHSNKVKSTSQSKTPSRQYDSVKVLPLQSSGKLLQNLKQGNTAVSEFSLAKKQQFENYLKIQQTKLTQVSSPSKAQTTIFTKVNQKRVYSQYQQSSQNKIVNEPRPKSSERPKTSTRNILTLNEKKPQSPRIGKQPQSATASKLKMIKTVEITKNQLKKPNGTSKTKLKNYVTQMKRGQIFPFAQQQSPTPSTQKSVTPSVNNVSTTTNSQNNNDQFNVFKKQLIQPAFKGCKYYQTSLIHFHFSQIKRDQQSPFALQFKLVYPNDDQYKYFRELFEEHYTQSYYALRYCKQLKKPSIDELKDKMYMLPKKSLKTIVFDLDETLIHCNENDDAPCDVLIDIDLGDNEPIKASINIRPFCYQMLQVLQEQFELIVFTASHQSYADKVLDYLDPKRSIFTHRFFRDSCYQIDENLFIKDLRVLGNRNLENMLIVDNASYSFCFQLANGVPIIPFYENKGDKELLYLTHYLLSLKDDDNWVRFNQNQFKFETYQTAQSMEKCLQELSLF